MGDAFTDGVEAMDDALARANEFLHNLRLGVDASVPLDDKVELAFGRELDNGKRRCLYVIRDGKALMLQAQSLAIRMQACRKIPALVEALHYMRDDQGKGLQLAADNLIDYLGELLDAEDLHNTQGA